MCDQEKAFYLSVRTSCGAQCLNDFSGNVIQHWIFLQHTRKHKHWTRRISTECRPDFNIFVVNVKPRLKLVPHTHLNNTLNIAFLMILLLSSTEFCQTSINGDAPAMKQRNGSLGSNFQILLYRIVEDCKPFRDNIFAQSILKSVHF